MTFASFFLQVLPTSPTMAARDADKEREIEATTDLVKLRHMRTSRRTQINKSRTELAGFQGKLSTNPTLITVDALINTFDSQASFRMLVQESISELVETAAKDPKEDQEYGAQMYGIIEVLKQDVLDFKAAVELFQDAEHVKRSLAFLDKHNMFQEEDASTELVEQKAEIKRLRRREQVLPTVTQLTEALDQVQLQCTADIRRATQYRASKAPPSTGTTPPSAATALRGSIRLPRIELQVFQGEQEKWRSFWDEFTKGPLLLWNGQAILPEDSNAV